MFHRGERFVLSSVFLLFILCFAALSAHSQTTSEQQPATVYELGERNLTLGSWGVDVFELQQLLKQAGYDVQTDGLFGKGTEQAVLAVQVAAGLRADGVAGAETLAALRSLHGTMEYTVQAGDSLWSIAQRFDTTMDEIFEMNRLTSSTLQIGMTLQVPAPQTYTVQPGDSLGVIAQRFNTTMEALAQLNNISDPHTIRAGDTLRIPN